MSQSSKDRDSDRLVARGIYWTRSGWRIFVRVRGRLQPKRIHDPLHELGLVALKEQREAFRVDVRRAAHLPPPSTAGTFAADAREKYLPAVKAMPGIAERTYHIELWIREFGARPRRSIQPWEIAQVRDRWLTEGPRRICVPWKPDDPDRPAKPTTGRWVEVPKPLSARQVNNRLRALENLWTVLDGRHAPNPVREAGEAPEVDPAPRALAYDVIEALLGAMPDRGRPEEGMRSAVSLTKVRLRVLAYTGLSHGELMNIQAADLHLEGDAPWVWVTGRRKGKGTKGTAQPLTEKGAEALRALAAADGLGAFSPDSMRKSLLRAAAKLEIVGIRPYDFRHSFATELLEKTGGNVGLTQLLMRQKDPRTTLRYSARAIDPVRLAGMRQAEARGAFTTARPKDDGKADTARRAAPRRR